MKKKIIVTKKVTNNIVHIMKRDTSIDGKVKTIVTDSPVGNHESAERFEGVRANH